MIQQDIITLTELFDIFNQQLSKDIGYCTIYEVLEDRKVFSMNEVDGIIENIKHQHLQRQRKMAGSQHHQPLSLVV